MLWASLKSPNGLRTAFHAGCGQCEKLNEPAVRSSFVDIARFLVFMERVFARRDAEARRMHKTHRIDFSAALREIAWVAAELGSRERFGRKHRNVSVRYWLCPSSATESLALAGPKTATRGVERCRGGFWSGSGRGAGPGPPRAFADRSGDHAGGGIEWFSRGAPVCAI